ncbi:MAG: PocR ligand-binding domain-containing protein [Christensenella sp.]|nr:PocR ligand-binding domain-containing protein [Christensenella sp.]
MPEFKIMDIFNTPQFQKLQDNIAESVGLAIIATDYTGTPITKHSLCTRFCCMVRDHPYYKTLCERCDSRGGLEAARTRTPYIYTCHSGIVDFAIPIIYNNAYLGAVMAGQVLLDNPENTNGLEQIYTDNSIAPLKTGNYYDAYCSLRKMKIEEIVSISNMLFSVCNMFLELEVSKRFTSPEEHAANFSEEKPSGSPANKNILTPVYEYIEKNIFDDLSLNRVASACNISANYLSRLFSKYNDTTFSNYVNQQKIEYAKKLLISTDMSVQEIALKFGYNDCSYFIKVFKKNVGVSPAIFRQQQ